MVTLCIEAVINVAGSYSSEQGQFIQTDKGTEFSVQAIAQFLARHADTMSITYESNLPPLDQVDALAQFSPVIFGQITGENP